jgi:hypothetical protein
MIELFAWIWEHRNEPLTWGLVLSFIVFAIDRLGRKLITNQVKKLFKIQDKNDFKQFAKNQRLIMENQKRMMIHLGVEPCAENVVLKNNTGKSSWIYLMKFPALFAVWSTQKKKTDLSLLKRSGTWMSEKLKSRKFWITVVSVLLVTVNDELGLGLDTESIMYFAGIVITYLLGQSFIDARKENKYEKNRLSDDEFVG